MASTYQRMSGGRLLMNVVTGADTEELARFGDWLDHDERYARTGEFLDVLRGSWSGEAFDFEGEHYRVRQLAAGQGRTLRFGIRFHVITRDTSAVAWVEADRLLDSVPDEAVAAAQADFARTQSVGQQRMASLHGNGRDRASLEIAPNVWAGVGLVRGGAGTALVGSHDEVADAIEAYRAVGFDEFILSGYPHLEEAYWFGENVMPILCRRGVLIDAGPGDPSADGSSDEPLATFR